MPTVIKANQNKAFSASLGKPVPKNKFTWERVDSRNKWRWRLPLNELLMEIDGNVFLTGLVLGHLRCQWVKYATFKNTIILFVCPPGVIQSPKGN